MKELKLNHEYNEILGADRGTVVEEGMGDIFAFVRARSRRLRMNRTACALLVVTVAMVSYGGRAFAHHSFAAEFDAQKPVRLKGTVVKWEMIKPHGWITIDVPGTDGSRTTPAACEALQKLQLDGVAVTIAKTQWFAAGAPLPGGRAGGTAAAAGNLPAYCRVDGVIDRRSGVPAGATYGIG